MADGSQWGFGRFGLLQWGTGGDGSTPVTLYPGGIATHFAAGAATVINAHRLILTGIASAAAVGSPGVSPTVGPTGIATQFAAGTANIAINNTVYPGGIATHFAAGTTFVANRQIVGGTGIPTRISIGVPNLAGPVIAVGIASGFAAGTAFVGLSQSVSLAAGIPSALAFGTAIVRHVQVVDAAGIASGFAAGTAKVFGTQRRVFPAGIAPGLVGTPGLVGGKPGVRVYVGGVDRTRLVRIKTATVDSQTIGRSNLKLDFYEDELGFVPAVGQTVLVMDSGVKVFAGCFNAVTIERPLSTDAIITHCEAIDKGGIPDHRQVNKTYKAGSEVCIAVRDLVANFLNGEGITTQGVPTTLALLTADVDLKFVSATQGLDRLAGDVGAIWWVDMNGVLHFDRVENLGPAPFALTETSKNWSALTVERSLQNYRNVEYAVSNLVVGTASNGGAANPGSLGAAITETYTLPQAAAVSRGFLFGAIVTKFPIRQLAQLKVNGVVQPVRSGITDAQYNFRHAWWYFPDYPYLTPPNAQNDTPSLPDPPVTSADPTIGDVVEIAYVPVNQNATVTSSSALTTDTGTCGSGIYEHAVQVKNVASATQLAAIAAALLARFNTVPVILKFQTDFPGLAVGQLLNVNIPKSDLVNSGMLITNVSAASQGVDLGRGAGGSFRYSITCAYPQDPGNWLKWFENFVATATAQPDPSSPGGGGPPVPQASTSPGETTFVLAPGGSLANGIVDSNRQIVNESGALFECMIDCGHPPVNADLQLDVFCIETGLSIFGQNKPRFVDGSTDLLVHTLFANGTLDAAATMLYAKQRLYPVATYFPKGSTYTPASNVTLRIRTR